MGSELFVNPPSLQVPQFINSGMMMQQSRPALPPRPDTGGSTRSGSQLLTGPDTSPAHLGYPGRRMGTSHPDLYRGHTPPPFGRGHTPPLTGGRGHTPPLGGRGITPPLLGQDMLSSQHSRTDYSLAQLAEKLERSNSGPTPGITLADLFHASEGQTKDWEDPVNANNPTSQAFTNIAALAQLDEMQEKKVSGGWDHNLLMPEMDRSRSHSALGNSGQLSPVPVPPLSPLLGVPGSHMDPRGASPISPIDSLMPCMSGMSLSPVPPFRPSRSINSMQVRCKFGTLGPGQFQFNAPHGFCLGIDEEIVVADTHNHRIVIYEKNGMYKNKFGVAGKDEGQLWYPRKVAVIKSSGKFVICDRGNERSRMQIFTKHGHWVRKIAIRYIDIVAGLAITRNEDIDHMREPSDIAVSGSEFFVCDFKGHNVVVFSEDGKFLRRIGYEKITNFPNGIDVSDHGDVLIGDSHGNRFHVAVFGSDGNLLAEFECPYVKVSRCCGLKLTSEGYVVTLAKNNHHVLVLNTLYIN